MTDGTRKSGGGDKWAHPTDTSWIARNTHCLTDCMGSWEEACITSVDPTRQRATVFVYDIDDDTEGWEFEDVHFARLLPDDGEPGRPAPGDGVAPEARELALKGLTTTDPDEALGFFVAALEKDPNHWYAAWECGQYYEEAGNWQSASAYYRKALTSPRGAERSYIHGRLGWCLGKLKKFAEEAEAYRACLERDPDCQNARNNLGFALLKLGQPEASMPVFEEAIRRGNDGKYPLRNLARALAKVGRRDEAVALLKKDVRGGKLTKAAENLLKKIGAPAEDKRASAHQGIATETEETGEAASAPAARRASAPVGFAFHKERHQEEDLVGMIARGQRVFDRSLRLYQSPDGRSGQQFALPGIGQIDVLAVDQVSGAFVVIELKKGRSDEDRVVGQISRYIGWVKKNLAQPGQQVDGIVCVHEASEKLKLAAAAWSLEVQIYGRTFFQRA